MYHCRNLPPSQKQGVKGGHVGDGVSGFCVTVGTAVVDAVVVLGFLVVVVARVVVVVVVEAVVDAGAAVVEAFAVVAGMVVVVVMEAFAVVVVVVLLAAVDGPAVEAAAVVVVVLTHCKMPSTSVLVKPTGQVLTQLPLLRAYESTHMTHSVCTPKFMLQMKQLGEQSQRAPDSDPMPFAQT